MTAAVIAVVVILDCLVLISTTSSICEGVNVTAYPGEGASLDVDMGDVIKSIDMYVPEYMEV